jgi:LemA protein
MIEWIALIVIAVIAVFLILAYNGFVQKKVRVENAWSQIDVQLKKRFDLVPNLVETVKGYAKHEKTVFENVTKARSAMMGAGTLAEKAKASDALSRTLKTLFAVAENYPQLRASENFKMLQEQLDGIESKIAYSRQFYNDSVMDYNTSLQVFPGNVFASLFGFKDKEFFGVASAAEREPVKVKFD